MTVMQAGQMRRSWRLSPQYAAGCWFREIGPQSSRGVSWWGWSLPPAETPQAGPAGPYLPRRPVQRSAYGQHWRDDYAWLERADTAEIQQILGAEAVHFQGWRRGQAALERQLRQEMLGLLPAQQVSVPERVGPYEYWVRWGHCCCTPLFVPGATAPLPACDRWDPAPAGRCWLLLVYYVPCL